MAEGTQGTAAATQEQRPPPMQPPNLRDPTAATPAAGAAAQHLQNGSTHARHHQQQHREAARPQPGRSVQQEPWRSAPTRLLPLSFKEGQVRVDENGPAVLEDMSQQASLSCTTAAGVMVLGLAAKDGPTSLEDIALGKVSFCLCLTSLPIQVGGRVQECYASALARVTWWLRVLHQTILLGLAGLREVCKSALGSKQAVTTLPACPPAPPLLQLRCRRWLCCARNKLFWMTPEWGTSTRELPPETQVRLRQLGAAPQKEAAAFGSAGWLGWLPVPCIDWWLAETGGCTFCTCWHTQHNQMGTGLSTHQQGWLCMPENAELPN